MKQKLLKKAKELFSQGTKKRSEQQKEDIKTGVLQAAKNCLGNFCYYPDVPLEKEVAEWSKSEGLILENRTGIVITTFYCYFFSGWVIPDDNKSSHL